VLLSFDHRLLKKILGLLVIGWSLFNLMNARRPSSVSRLTSPQLYLSSLVGFLGGGLGAMFSVNGPPIIIYMTSIIEEKQIFRSTLYGIFFADACYKVILFTANNLLNAQVLRFAILMMPFLVIGTFAGSLLQKYIPQALFKRVVALILLVTGVTLLL